MKTIIAVIFLVFAIIIGMSTIEQSFNNGPTNSSIDISLSDSSSFIEEKEVVVILTGEILNPGTYTINKDEYLDNAIQLAGGVTSKADHSCFDYFYIIEEDVSIYIAPVSEESKISLNEASLELLVTLDGIGPTLANLIIQYRIEHGGFKCLEDIMNVSGIGIATFEKNKNKICL